MLRVPFGSWNGLLIYWQLQSKEKIKTINLPGYKASIYLRSGTSDESVFIQVFCQRDYDFPFDKKVKYILDGGANIGLTAVFLAQKYPNAFIISVEPDEANLKMIELNTASYPNIKILRAAIWNEDTSINIYDDGHDSWGFITDEKRIANNAVATVPAYNIASIAKKFSIPFFDIVKLDIEGSEKEVFESNYEVWLDKANYVLVELHDRLKNGCTKNFFAATSKYNFHSHLLGEHIVLTKVE